jgi:hypothetical protein
MDRILIDGFPRSGNTFFHNLLKESFPDIEIPYFRHSVETFSPETYVMLRDPQDSICSFMSMFRHNDLKSAEDWWIRYYTTAKKNNVKFIQFEDLISDPRNIVKRISKETGYRSIDINVQNLSKNKSFDNYKIFTVFDRAEILYKKLRDL